MYEPLHAVERVYVSYFELQGFGSREPHSEQSEPVFCDYVLLAGLALRVYVLRLYEIGFEELGGGVLGGGVEPNFGLISGAVFGVSEPNFGLAELRPVCEYLFNSPYNVLVLFPETLRNMYSFISSSIVVFSFIGVPLALELIYILH